ncbi:MULTISPECIES: hypothetical protein [Halorussus]|uniref:hypothetical protein n=1 Tax=Halorussus TaxID=1070314 RepID=UPI00209E50E2|nr:hypothetical protein [Halorussus vallis]USZ77770.1 hypothetical protein NGM07_21550 [Halorussus vallis]
MVEFQLKRVLEVADWVRVTSGMAPDEIEYVIRTPQGVKIEKSDSLVVLTKLYGCAQKEVPSAEYPVSEFYTVVEDGDQIEIGRWDMDEPITTTYEELRTSLEPFLAEIFSTLNRRNGCQKRREAIEYMNNQSGLDFGQLYERLMNQTGR